MTYVMTRWANMEGACFLYLGDAVKDKLPYDSPVSYDYDNTQGMISVKFMNGMVAAFYYPGDVTDLPSVSPQSFNYALNG